MQPSKDLIIQQSEALQGLPRMSAERAAELAKEIQALSEGALQLGATSRFEEEPDQFLSALARLADTG